MTEETKRVGAARNGNGATAHRPEFAAFNRAYSRQDSQLSHFENDNELLLAVKRDVERVFSLLLRRSIKSPNFEIDEVQLEAILGMLDVTAEIGSSGSESDRTSKSRIRGLSTKPQTSASASASNTIDMRIQPIGEVGVYETLPEEADSNSLSQYKSTDTKLSSGSRRKTKNGGSSTDRPRRDKNLLKRIQRALRILIDRHSKSKDASDSDSTEEQRKSSSRQSQQSIVGHSSEIYDPYASRVQTSAHSNVSKSSQSRGSSTHPASHDYALAKLGPEIAAASERREMERERRRGLSKVLNDIKAFGKRKSRHSDAAESSTKSKSHSAPASAVGTQRIHHATSPPPTSPMQSQSLSHSPSKQVKDKDEEVRFRSLGEFEYGGRFSNVADSSPRSFSRRKTEASPNGEVQDVAIDLIVERVEEVVKTFKLADETHSPTTVPKLEVVPSPLSQVGRGMGVAAAADGDGDAGAVEDQALSAQTKSENARREELDNLIADSLKRCCDEGGDLFNARYANNPAQLKRLDVVAAKYLASSNYDLFASAMSHEASHATGDRRNCSCSDLESGAKDTLIKPRSATTSSFECASSSLQPPAQSSLKPQASESDVVNVGAGMFTLFYMARRATDVGVNTAAGMRNVKANLSKYFSDRYAQFFVDNSGFGAVMAANGLEEDSVSEQNGADVTATADGVNSNPGRKRSHNNAHNGDID